MQSGQHLIDIDTIAMFALNRLEDRHDDPGEPVPLEVLLSWLEDDDWKVRSRALGTLYKLGPATIAQHALAVIMRMKDPDWSVSTSAVFILSEMEPTVLAQHADALHALLEHSNHFVRVRALRTLFQLEPATLAWHANAVVARLEDSDIFVRDEALATLKALPHVVTRGVDLRSTDVRSRLLGRLAWHRFRLLKRVQRIALYWYALPYRPSGAGHARDVEAWAQMVEIQDHRNISS